MKQTYQNQDPKDLIRVIKDLQQRKQDLLVEETDVSQKVMQYVRASDDTAAQVSQLQHEATVLRQRTGAVAARRVLASGSRYENSHLEPHPRCWPMRTCSFF